MTSAAEPEPEPVADSGEPVVRRAPFSANPAVGARGQRTQQRILDAALEVFGEVGYHKCSIDRIAKVAGCSRISFYQYFSSKEDVFRQLAGQVARLTGASTEELGPVTTDAAGWDQLRAWVGRYGDIHERYAPVFTTFQAAVSSDEAIAGGSVRAGERHVTRFKARLERPVLPPRRLDPTIDLLTKTITAAFGIAAVLRTAAPAAYTRDRVDDALTDVLHRTLFGLQPDVNAHPPPRRGPPTLDFGPTMSEVLAAEHGDDDLTPAGRRTLDALLEAGRGELIRRGYHGTRVDDIATAAHLSHGAFYRYFTNKNHFARLVAGEAMREVSLAFAEIPTEAVHDPADGDGDGDGDGDDTAATEALRTWLRRYNAAQTEATALVRVWADAAAAEPDLRSESAAVFDWGRRRMARFLAPRGFGDVDTEAIAMVALLEAFGARPRPTAAVDTAALVIECGLLGRPAT